MQYQAQPAPATAGTDLSQSRFTEAGNQQLQTAAFGVNSVDWLKNSTQGREDVSKRIKLKVQEGYFSYSQAAYLGITAFCWGVGLWTIVYIAIGSIKFDLTSGGVTMKLGFLLLGFWIAALSTYMSTKGNRQCDPNSALVKSARRGGSACLTDFDCVPANVKSLRERTCKYRSHSGVRGKMRFAGVALPPVLAAVMIGVGVTRAKPSAEEALVAVSLGIGIGSLFMFVAS